MKVLLLNGAKAGDRTAETIVDTLTEELVRKGHNLDTANLSDKKIGSCLGCFGCWIKTPGECVIKDEGRDIAKSVVQSDLFITVTPITFGGYSYELKKAMDRLIPLLSPLFMKINGEVHHKPRYERYPNWLSIGILKEMDEEQADSFRNLVNRNAINFHNPTAVSCVLVLNQLLEDGARGAETERISSRAAGTISSEEIAGEIQCCLREVGV